MCVYYLNTGTLLIGTDRGLNYLDVNSEKFSVESKLKNSSIINIDEINGEILFFTDKGIYKKSNESVVLFKAIDIFSNVSSNNRTYLFWKKGNSELLHNRKNRFKK